MHQTPRAVIDTNAILDWLVFRDPMAAGFGSAIADGRLEWWAAPAMRCEFDDVLARPALAARVADHRSCTAAWSIRARMVTADPVPGPLRCRDPDDQVFIDLALALRCHWLLTRDRALLALALPARAWGLTILTPAAWLRSSLPPFAPPAG
jgi:predicted nucleic acid-binding protein